jgi:septal ring factor EnvC (AmiA/AmiB activator)
MLKSDASTNTVFSGFVLFRYSALLLLLGCAVPVAAQDAERQAAEQRLQQLKAQIEEFEQQLTRTRREETDAAAALAELDREITVREALIESYRDRQKALSAEALQTRQSMAALETQLAELREEYAARARNAYMRGRVGDLALILSAGSINQMIVRTRYLQRFTRQRQEKLDQIGATQAALADRQAALDSSATRIQALLAESRAEQQALARRKNERASLVRTLRQKSAGIASELQQRQQDMSRLESRIQEMIAAAEAARRREAEAARTAASASRRAEAAAATSEFVELTGSFRENKGKLPWPTSGVVTGTFGTRTHPVYGTKTRSIGIEISTSPTAPVRAVFAGQVERIFAMPGYGTCVMVSHGDYATIYANLSSVNVQQGQRVRAGEGIARAGTADDPLGAGMFFGLFAESQAVDPAAWLQRQ